MTEQEPMDIPFEDEPPETQLETPTQWGCLSIFGLILMICGI